MSGFDDFDFLIGNWTVTNTRLRKRLVDSDDWETFTAFSHIEKVMQAPDGSFGGNLDQMAVPERGFAGMTLRLYNPETGLWSIYWSDTRSYRLFPPVVGQFTDGRGVFYGDDIEGGVPVRVRYIWTPDESPRWEQAMSVDGGETWELNWVMRFERQR